EMSEELLRERHRQVLLDADLRSYDTGCPSGRHESVDIANGSGRLDLQGMARVDEHERSGIAPRRWPAVLHPDVDLAEKVLGSERFAIADTEVRLRLALTALTVAIEIGQAE